MAKVREREVEQTLIASLRILSPAEEGKATGGFAHSNNMFYESTLDDLKSICAAIKEDGTVTVDGLICDGIKPVIKVVFSNKLPIAYKPVLSGYPQSGESVSGWVLRAEQETDLITLCKVSGVDATLSSGVVTAYDHTDWRVRESREYVDVENKRLIGELEGEGFIQLVPSEGDPKACDLETLKNGSLVLMCRQVLALKFFSEEDALDVPVSSTSGAPGILAVASDPAMAAGATPTPAYQEGIPPIVANANNGKTPPRKKQKTEVE